MGVPRFDSMPPNGAQSPREEPLSGRLMTDLSFWDHCTASDVIKYLVIFQEEVQSVYPFIDISEYIAQSKGILQAIRNGGLLMEEDESTMSKLCSKDINLARVAIATGIILEEPSKIELSTAIVNSVETIVSIILTPRVDLKEIQLTSLLSIYYFHSGEELLSWRTIGIAARKSLELGLHRKRSLLDNFKDSDSRRLAARVFWCVYILDRQWSFGTTLSFALVEKEIDPELPKPDEEYPYLQCMVGHGQLCSKIWDALPPLGSASQSIPDNIASGQDLCIQDWLNSIPPYLRLHHPRLGLTPQRQPRLSHYLRALLYLRGNHTRILIYRHHLISTASITASLRSALLVVDIAQDSIQVLVHLHATTDIYLQQQNVFNDFLLSALAVLFLAVCHAPETFSALYQRTFSEAGDLVKDLSRYNIVSKRLWRSIRDMIRRIKVFGFLQTTNEENGVPGEDFSGIADEQNKIAEVTTGLGETVPMSTPQTEAFTFGDISMPDTDLASSGPDMFHMRNDLLNLFNAFEQGQQFLQPIQGTLSQEEEFAMATEQRKDISMRFQGLI
ncbi:hypothetical protein FOXG_13062 [Fusarium oxysporum f. sp. lycopersici 4287]|uniref:Xylanolytic transcriptional activator regulatory domain-containing protein n=1 Tax=Fusarium oxysporum f. sp. lycopersici (strain 4287 / CBS 123668 / FGSC 9935 / NRRL 34936) TaxID=426428 RepID=A0A0J9VU33_FUSO4|nr:hypothetical protein FOXG_13062 [Fusarium oxysporum f. sp. lycopersici 4287]KNB14130.1 hypothetical protein FOXG_13062 [Fusarium oxysporum f. sp. lycopersici 4287]